MRVQALFVSGVSLLAFASPSVAQDQGAYLDEIVVEARRRDESAQEVPLVVNAVTSDAIEKLNIREFKEITSLVPGLNMASNANGIGTTSSVRGVNFDVNASGNNGTIEYYLNDAPMSSGPLFQALYDIGQIEVLRGPQGTLRGRASPSGSITITYRRPDMQEVGGYVNTTVNDIGTWNGNLALNIPVVADLLAVRVAGLLQDDEGNRVRSINNDRKPFNRAQSGRVTVAFTPTDFLSFDGMYQNVNTESAQFAQVASFSNYSLGAPSSPRPISARERLGVARLPRAIEQNYDMFTWRAALQFAGQKLTYVGSRLEQDINSADPNLGDPNAFFDEPYDGTVTHTYTKGTSHEVRLQNEARVFDMFDYVAGYFRQTLNSPSDLLQDTALGLPNGQLIQVITTPIARRGSSKEESFFGNITVHLGEGTEFSGGARHIKFSNKASLAVAGNIVPAANDDREFSKTIFAASAKHRFNDSIMAYVNFGTSFRPGISVTGDFSVARSPLENSFLILPPETSKSYEAGVKLDLLDRRLRLNLAVYQQDFKNYPYRSASGVYFVQYDAARDASGAVTVTPSTRLFNFVSPVPVRVRGFEAELTYRPDNHFSLSANVAYADGKIRNGLVACNDLNKDGIPDIVTAAPTVAELQAAYGADNLAACNVSERSANAPRWSGNIQSEYSLPVTDSMDGYLRGLLSWNGNSQNDPVNAFDDYGAYALLNLYAGLRAADGAWEVSAFVKNLTNNRTVLSVGNGPLATPYRNAAAGGAPATFTGTYTNVSMVAPREFGITGRIAFGSR